MKNSTSRFFLGVMGVAGLLMMCGPGAHAQSAAVQKTTTVQKAEPAPTGEPMEKASADRQVVQADGSASTVVITDWSSHHMVFSNPAKAKPAVREKIVTNPRYIMQLKRQALSSRTIKFNSEADRVAAESAASQNAMNALTANSKSSLIIGNAKKQPPPPPPPPMAGTRDWNMSLGSGTVAPGQFPAEVTAGESTITGTGGASPTGNCLTDFVVFGLNTVGTNTQANLIAFDDLYSGTTGSPICGTTANTKWAYNTSTISGTISNSPVTSGDGTMVAFVENSAGGAAALHVLRWKDSNGTISAPVTPTAVASMSACSTAPCMATVQFTSNGDSISSPFYDFITDTAYVGDNEGFLYAITGVFYGTPTVSNTAPFSSSGLQVSQFFGGLTSPVYDFTGSGNIFVGSADGFLYAVNATTGAVASVQAGNGTGSGAITDPPTVDSSNQRVIVSAGTNTAGSAAVVLQADTTTPLGNVVTATVGTTEGSSLVAEQGIFDTGYYNWSGTGANTGHFYVVGGAATTTAPTLYQIPFSGVASVNVSGTATGGSSNPTVSFSGGGGSGAAGVASGGIFGVNISNAGTGYTSFPTPTFSGGGGSGAAGNVSDMKVLTVTGLVGGSNFQGPTTATINGSGPGGETATASLGIDVVTVSTPGAYTTQPAAVFGGGGSGATSTTTSTVTAVNVTANGSGYTSFPTISFGGTHSVTPTATTNLGLNAVTVSAGGTGYTTVPSVSITGGGGAGGASATAALGLVTGTYTVTGGNGGTYTGIPTVSFSGGGTGAAGGASVGFTTVNVTSGGSGYTALPTFTPSGTHSTAAAFAATMGLNSVAITAAGTGYTTAPTVSITGGTGSGASDPGVTMKVVTAALGGTTCYSASVSSEVISLTGGSGSGANVAAHATSRSTCSSGQFRLVIDSVNAAGSGYTASPSATVPATNCVSGCSNTITSTMGVNAIAGPIVPGSYTALPTVAFSGGGGSGATLTAGYTVVSVAVTTPGAYSTYPTLAISGNATVSIPSTTVTLVTVTGAGTGFSTGPSTVSFSPTGATAPTVPLTVVSVGSIVPGSYSATLPTVAISGGGGSGATVSAKYALVSVTVGTGGSCTTFPTPTLAGGGGSGAAVTSTVAVVSVAVTAAGTGYSGGPVAVTFSGTGSGGAGTADLKVASVALAGGGGDYTTVPTLSFSDATGSGASASLTLGVLAVAITSQGTGYTGTITVGFTGGAGSGAAGSATIAVNAVQLTYGGGGYSTPPTVTISGASGLTATATVNPGNVLTAGTSPNKLAISATAGVQTSPVSDVFNTATNSDTLFYGFGTATTATDVAEVSISAAGVLGATQTLAAEPASVGASSGIVVDPFTSGTNNQANSIYFATQGSGSSDIANISGISSNFVFSGNSTATVTTSAATDFVAGDTVVIAGTTCSGLCDVNFGGAQAGWYNGTWVVVTKPTTTTFTFTVCTGLCGSGSAGAAGTATDNGLNNAKISFKAVKLTQAGLQ